MVELELETIVVIIISSIIILYLLWNIIKMKLGHKAAIKDARKDTAARQRSTIKGDISEIIAPWSIKSVNSVKELNFMGSPIDFVGFKGLDGDGEIEIKFIEIKSGKSKLNKNQRRIRDAVVAKRIEWVEVRVKDTEIEIEEKILQP
jgi:predicted Holliday junction resolvase-like endonuclease|tara:strand:- start:26 stop:466 length:441 start_codon:yes stop_codon:yes gene_type:complete